MFPSNKGVLFAIGGFAILCLLALDDDLKVQHDSGMYIALGKSLASGQGYKEIFFAEQPPHTQYPPIFPLLLTPLIALLGYHVLAMKLLVIAIAVFTLYILYIFFRELANERMASLLVLFTASSHGLLFFSQSIMTEIPYLCFSLLALLWIHRYSRQTTWPSRAAAVIVVLLPLAYLTRLVGLSLLLATVLYLLYDGTGKPGIRVKRAIVIGGIAGVPALGWLLRNWWVAPRGAILYGSAYHLDWVYAPPSELGGLSLLLNRVSSNLVKYVRDSARVIFFHTPWVSETVIPLLLASLIFGGFLWCVLRKRTIVEYYMFVYIGAVLLFPGTRPQRYLVPLIPFIWYYFLTAGEQIFSWFKRRALLVQPSHQRMAILATKLLLVMFLISNGAMATLGNVVYHGRERYYHVVGEEGYTDVIPWVKAHTPPDSVFMWAKPSLRFLWSERRAVHYQGMQEEEIMHSISARKVDYVVVDSFAERTQSYVRAMVGKYPDHFCLVYQDKVSKVYKVINTAPEMPRLLNGIGGECFSSENLSLKLGNQSSVQSFGPTR